MKHSECIFLRVFQMFQCERRPLQCSYLLFIAKVHSLYTSYTGERRILLLFLIHTPIVDIFIMLFIFTTEPEEALHNVSITPCHHF